MDNPLSELREAEGGGWLAEVRVRWWASLIVLLLLWALISLVSFPILGLVTNSVTIGLLSAPIVGLAAAGALGHKLGFVEPIDEARRGAPLWARLLVPIPVFALLWMLFLVAVGAFVQGFLLLAVVTTLLAAVLTAAGIASLGLWRDVGPRLRESTPPVRLGLLALAGALVGFAAFAGIVMGVGSVPLALAALVPVAILAGGAIGHLTGWGEDAYEAVRGSHFGIRIAGFLVLEVLLTLYVAVLVGGFLTDARFAYAIGVAAGLAVLVPVSIWVRTWRDLWEAFVDMGEENRVLVLLPTFPLAAFLVFSLIVVLTGSFEAAYIVSVPAGVAALLALGWPLGVTRRIPPIVRRQPLPMRSAIFLTAFAILSAYAYFGIALIVQDVEISLVAGMAFAGLVLAIVNRIFDLDRGLGEEFEAYGAPAEAAVLGGVFVLSLALAFLALALTTGDFRLAFLVSVVVAAGLNYLIAHTTGLVESMRTVVGDVPWWGDVLILGAVFAGVTAYVTLAVGVFVNNAPIALSIAVVFGLAGVVFFSRDLAIGEDVLQEAEEESSARAVVLLLAFLGGFLAGLYVTAAAMSLTGSAIFGFPLFVGLVAGSGAVIALARMRDWDEDVLGRVRSRTDKLKVATILAAWLAIGILTGFFLTSLPITEADLGIGSSPSLPPSITIGVGLLLWIWLPLILFRTLRVERGPAEATLETRDGGRALASAGWGLLAFAVVLVFVLSLFNRPVVAVGSGLAVGYLVALLISTRGSGERPEDPEAGS